MSKYIDVDVFIKSFREALPGLKAQVDPDLTPKAYAYLRGGEAIIEDLTKFPAADVAPVVHGRWEDSTGDWLGTDVYTCSICRESYVLVEGTPKENLWHYCPNCGAQMHEDDFCRYGECREDKDEK